MKALSFTAFDHSKESQTALYKQFVRLVLTYAIPAWAPDLARSHMEVMQRTQNAALRIATGCVRSTTIAHLDAETRVLSIMDHLNMRRTQLIESANCPHHPLHHLHLPPQGDGGISIPHQSVTTVLCVHLFPLPLHSELQGPGYISTLCLGLQSLPFPTPYSRRSPCYLPNGGHVTKDGQGSLIVPLAVRFGA